MDRVKASIFITADGRFTNAIDLKTMLSGGFVLASRNDAAGAYRANVEILLEYAKDGLSAKSTALQASTVISFIKDTAPDSLDLRRYLPWDEQQTEMARRAKSTASERFVPLLIDAIENDRDGGYPELKKAHPQACNGTDYISYIALLAARAKLSTTVDPTICRTLCHMLKGTVLAYADTAQLRTASNEQRNKALGDVLAISVMTDKDSTDKPDEAAAQAVRDSQVFKDLITSLEANNIKDPRDSMMLLTGEVVHVDEHGHKFRQTAGKHQTKTRQTE